MADDWKIKKTADGYKIFWRGREWYDGQRPIRGTPNPPRDLVASYVESCKRRYPGDTPGILLGPEDAEAKVRRGGPWRWTLPDGETGVIHTSRKSDAKKVLRHKMQRKRLPNGIEWEIA